MSKDETLVSYLFVVNDLHNVDAAIKATQLRIGALFTAVLRKTRLMILIFLYIQIQIRVYLMLITIYLRIARVL